MPWTPAQSDLKTYKHFDQCISVSEVTALVSDPYKVASHKFMPFLHFEKSWRRAPLLVDGQRVPRDPKVRPIRYAARKDAYIFKYYREMLSELYEAQIGAVGIGESVLAYRSIPKADGDGNKSNIEFAKEAFEHIRGLRECCAVAIDISSYFESVSHARIKEIWCDLLGVSVLPEDHYAVFKNLTRFSWVDRDEAFLALGYSSISAEGKLQFNISPKEIPLQICSNEQFRDKIVRGGLIRKKKRNETHGIPQGAPLSDLIANVYLMEFDIEMRKFASVRGGFYFRYSDDILLILPGDGRAARSAYQKAATAISEAGDKLRIKPEKTEVTIFNTKKTGRRCYSLQFNSCGKLVHKNDNEGFSYLGFRFDGERFYLRNSTVTNLLGKIQRSCNAVALNHVDRHLDKELPWLLQNAPINELTERFFQVQDFEESISTAKSSGRDPFKKMTFFTYANRVIAAYGSEATPIRKQVSRVKRQIRRKLDGRIIAKFQTRLERLAFRKVS